MKILHLNTSDTSGGAARAAYRIHKGLQGLGIDSKMLVQTMSGDDKTVIGPVTKAKKGLALLRPTLDSSVKKLFPGESKTFFSPAWLPFSDIPSQIKSIAPDIVHLHWICDGMLRIEKLKRINKPIIWTLHDMWAFTGGCHYNEKCDRYKNECGCCFQLESKKKKDISHWVWKRKKKAWENIDLTIVTPSKWLARCATKSSLFKNRRIEVINNGINLQQYKTINHFMARKILNLPKDKILILFGAMSATTDKRKGFHLLHKAMNKFNSFPLASHTKLVIFGSSKPYKESDFGLETIYLGQLHDDISLALLYAASDVFICPSIQDNLPNTIVESLSCGTPCVAFDIGGMPDMIDHKINGYLARPFDPEDFAMGIDFVISGGQNLKLEHMDNHKIQDMKTMARKKAVNNFCIKKVAIQYSNLYKDIINTKK
jgi:glycosyltransferase involved in cell wall biosynthesis